MIKRSIALIVAAALIGAGTTALAGKKKKASDVHASVTYAKTWDKAVEEAKLLNVPIVVHIHGFY